MKEISDAKILLVEDSSFSRALILSALRELGFEHITYPDNAAEAWEQIVQSLLEENPFDLLITDLNMPEIDGMDLIARIKEDEFSRHQKIIVISADADPKIKERCLTLGAQAYLTKPFEPASLHAAIVSALKN